MRLFPLVLTVCALTVAACGQQPDSSTEPAGSGDAKLTSRFTLDDGRLTVSFTLRNTGDDTLVVFDRGWVADAAAPTDAELESTADDVQVIAAADTVEFGLRIIHACHGNPQGERSPDTDGQQTDCGSDAERPQAIAASRVEPGEKLSREYAFDAASVWIDFPSAKARATIDVSGEQVEFCLGVDRPRKPAKDDMYPPDTDETVLCGEKTTVS